jgi:hypothetical protein
MLKKQEQKRILNRNIFLNDVTNILLDFDNFKLLVENNPSKVIDTYFKGTDDIDIIEIEHQLLEKYNAIQLNDIFIEFFTYITYLKNYLESKEQKDRCKFVYAELLDSYKFITDKLLDIEINRFICILNKYGEILDESFIDKICRDFSLSKQKYNFLIGYDINSDYRQLSFIKKEDNIDKIDNSSKRRFCYKERIILETEEDVGNLKQNFYHYEEQICSALGEDVTDKIKETIEKMKVKVKKKEENKQISLF